MEQGLRPLYVPLLIHRAFEGDLDAFARRGVAGNRGIRDNLAFGMLLCGTCSEDIPRIDPGDIAPLTDGTFLGDGRVRRQMKVCEIWPRSDVPAGTCSSSSPTGVDISQPRRRPFVRSHASISRRAGRAVSAEGRRRVGNIGD